MIHYERGIYQCQVMEHGWQQAKSGKDMLVFQVRPDYRILTDDAGNEELEQVYDDPRGPERTLRIVIDPTNENMMDFALKKLRACGFEGTSFADLNLVGRDIRAICEEGEYNGRPKEDWDFYLPFRQSEIKPLDSAMSRKLDALFGRKLKETAAEKPKPQPAAPSQPPTNGEPAETVPPNVPDDEVPF